MGNLFKIIFVVLVISQFGCSTTKSRGGSDDVLLSQSGKPQVTKTRKMLQDLPPPAAPIVAAVYKLRDQSGQYKPSPSNSFSTAVTQGATAILSKAMLDSGWFFPMERESLQNLLTERKIVRASNKETKKKLSALPPAQVIIEGGVVAYDSNIRTGGIGARFLGIGGFQQYREDQVTVNLRVVNVANGRIIHSVYSTKKIFSKQLDSGVFGYASVDKLLELEVGYSYNEPAQLCVMDAIETALMGLIVKGVEAGSWKLKNSDDFSHPVFEKFYSS